MILDTNIEYPESSERLLEILFTPKYIFTHMITSQKMVFGTNIEHTEAFRNLHIISPEKMVLETIQYCSSRPQQWSIFQSDGMVNVFFQATIDFNGFSMVLTMLDHHH